MKSENRNVCVANDSDSLTLERGANFNLEFIGEFLKRSDYHEMEFARVADQMEAGEVWTIRMGQDAVGFVYGRVQEAEYEGLVFVIQGLYVEPRALGRKVIALVDAMLDQFCIEEGISEVAFFTRRDPKMMLRVLKGTGWGLDSVVFKRGV